MSDEPTRLQATGQSFWKLIAIALFLALIGVYFLYEWYDDRLYDQIAQKDGLIVQLSERFKETEAKRLAAEEGWNASRDEIKALNEQFQTERQQLNDQIRMLEEIKVGLGQDMEGIKAAHAAVLADERNRTAQVVAEKERVAQARDELQAQLEAEREKVFGLKADLAKVNQAIADAATSHQNRVAELERHLNERVSLARTTPEDAEVLRMVQELGYLGTPEGRSAEAQALAEELETTKTQLELVHKDHEATRARLAEAQSELQRIRLELELSQRSVAQAERAREALGEAQARAVELDAGLSTEREVRAALQQQHEAAIAALNETLSERDRRLTELESALAAARSEGERLTDEAARLADANARVQSLETALEEARVQDERAASALREELAESRAKLAEAETKLDESERARRTSSEAENQALAEAQERIQALQSELDEARASDKSQALAEAQARVQALQSELDEARASDKSQALAEAQARVQALESELETVRAQAVPLPQDGDMGEASEPRAAQASLAELNGIQTPRGLLLNLDETALSFPAGKATLPKGELASLDRIAAILSKHPELTVRIEGHTDSLGSESLNLSLSRQRAEAVRRALIERGVADERLSAEGIGPARPIADNDTFEGRSKNRRVEIYILD